MILLENCYHPSGEQRGWLTAHLELLSWAPQHLQEGVDVSLTAAQKRGRGQVSKKQGCFCWAVKIIRGEEHKQKGKLLLEGEAVTAWRDLRLVTKV